MFYYGDSTNNGVANNVMGDCDITHDGRYMVATMGTGGGVSTNDYIGNTIDVSVTA